MAKRTKRHSARSQRNNAGCMWGLISLFDFRWGLPTHRLLSNQKYGSTSETGTECSTAKLDSLRSFPNKHEGGTLGDAIREDQVNVSMTSVKALMEEEMSKHFQKEISCKSAEPKLQDEVHSQRIYKQGSNKSKLVFDNQENNLVASTSLDGLYSDSTKQNELSMLNFDLATSQQMRADGNNKLDLLPALQRIGSRSHKHLNDFDGHFDQKISFFRQTLADVTQAMVEKPADARWFVESKEFIEVLEILNSDQELFLNLLQDPNSLLKCIQHFHRTQISNIFNQGADRSFENAQLIGEENNNSGKCMESDSNQLVQKQNRYNFFWRKSKSKGTKPSKEEASSKSSNRIVVLKPRSVRDPNTSVTGTPDSSPLSHYVLGHNQNGERIVSHFSLREITRRLGHLVSERRKTHDATSADDLHRISVTSGEADDLSKLFKSGRTVPSLANSSLNDKKLSESLSFASRKIEKNDSEECEVNINGRISPSTSRSPSSIYEEAKRHIAEMLDNRDDGWANYPAPEPLERVLSLPRYNELSPVSTTQRDPEHITSAEEGGDPSCQQLNQEDLVDTNVLELSLIRQDLNGEGSTEIFEFGAVDDQSIIRTNRFTILSELSADGLMVADEICEEESSTLRALGSCEEKSSIAIQSKLPPYFLITENLVASESTTEKPEQPSPVSVLETFLPEDIASPGSSTENYDIQSPRQLANYEACNNSLQDAASPYLNERSVDCLFDQQARFDYVEAVLEASGLTNDLSERWNLEDQLLEPSLFDAIGIFFCFLQDDPKLLFDCINELLVEIQERFLKCTPWMSFIKQNILPVPRRESLIQEVSKGLESHLQIQVPSTLDQLVRKDLEGRSWMDLRFEAEKITSEICDIVLNDLMKESVRASWF